MEVAWLHLHSYLRASPGSGRTSPHHHPAWSVSPQLGGTPKPAETLEAEPLTMGSRGWSESPGCWQGRNQQQTTMKSSCGTIRLNLGQVSAPLFYINLTLSNLFKTSVNSPLSCGWPLGLLRGCQEIISGASWQEAYPCAREPAAQ